MRLYGELIEFDGCPKQLDFCLLLARGTVCVPHILQHIRRINHVATAVMDSIHLFILPLSGKYSKWLTKNISIYRLGILNGNSLALIKNLFNTLE